MSGHTLVLVQYSKERQSRTFYDYKTVDLAAEGVTSIFERQLKDSNPTQLNVSYTIDDLYYFLDNVLNDISALVFDEKLQAYIPYNKGWIKGILSRHIQKYISPNNNNNRGRRK